MKTCFYCKGPLRRRRVEHMHESEGERYLIKNVEAEVCGQCGETFFAPATLREIDRIVSKGRPKGHVSVAVFELKPRAA